MPRPDFRALCAELLAELEDCFTISKPAGDPLIQRARAALAQPATEPTFTDEEVAMHSAPWSYLNPAPESPTDEELLAMAAKAIEPYNSWGIAVGAYESETKCAVEAYGSELVTFARAVLARWGQPQPASEPTFTDEELKAMWLNLERRGQGNG